MTGIEMSLESIVKMVNSKRGQSGGWPRFIDYIANESAVTLVLNSFFKGGKKDFRQFDAWGMAFVGHLENTCAISVNKISFLINSGIQKKDLSNLEALRRRLSFLQINAHKSIDLVLRGSPIPLDENLIRLFSRPEHEVIRKSLKPRGGEDNIWRLEKDLQAFLFGQGFEKDDRKKTGPRPNGRLAILGNDFRGSNKKSHGVLREFPTGAFNKKVSEATRILPTEYVDLISLDKHGSLAVIELKVDDSSLEVISQTLDYALFFGCYLEQILEVINGLDVKEGLSEAKLPKSHFNVYMVSNVYHPRMKDILRYYGTKNKDYCFSFKQINLGYTQEEFE